MRAFRGMIDSQPSGGIIKTDTCRVPCHWHQRHTIRHGRAQNKSSKRQMRSLCAIVCACVRAFVLCAIGDGWACVRRRRQKATAARSHGDTAVDQWENVRCPFGSPGRPFQNDMPLCVGHKFALAAHSTQRVDGSGDGRSGTR